MASYSKRNPVSIAIHVIVYGIVFITVFYLFYRESTGAFHSDLSPQIDAAINPTEDAYTITKPIFAFLYSVSWFYGIAGFLALCEMGTIAVSELLLRKLMPNIRPCFVLLFAVLCNFAVAIYIPALHFEFNVGVSEGNEWHNATYTVMRLLAILAMWYWMKLDERFGQGISKRVLAIYWLCFTLFTVAATAIKPSFAIVFGPALVLFCLIDVIRHGNSALRKSLLFALSMIIVLLVVLYQYKVLFASGNANDGGIGIGFAVVWSMYHDNLLIAMIQSYAFILLVLIACWRHLCIDRNYLMSLLVFVVALMEYLVFYETGSRAQDGNFDWGLSFAVYYVMLTSVGMLMRHASLPVWFYRKPQSNSVGSVVMKNAPALIELRGYAFLTLLVFGLHSISGIFYYVKMLLGGGFI